ncbi:MAG: arylsulfatase [Rikenellaceae bacterium]|nr:arylsulfatase [Rikenellaceae bacterium]
MKNYDTKKILGISGIVMATVPLMNGCAEVKAEEPPKPNIIYILADDLGYGDLSCYGQQHFQTPNLDRMADEGIKFTQHYAGASMSAPSRCALMTGMHTGHATIRDNFSATRERVPLTPEDVTIAKLFQNEGYSTAMFGKWGLGELNTTGVPTEQGFDKFFGYINQRDAHSYYPVQLQCNTGNVELAENENGQHGIYSHDLIHDKAMKYIREQAESEAPFLVFLTYTLPHAELLVPDDDLMKFVGKFPEVPYPGGQGGERYLPQPYPKAAYAGMVTRLDRNVGELFDLLKELGIDDNTIVMFTSDNGPHQEGGNDPEFFNSSGGLRGIKRSFYEGGIREPMIVRWPEKIQPGTVTDHISAFWDVMPTMCEIAGIGYPDNIDGVSFLPVLKGAEMDDKDHILYWELNEGPRFKQAVRMGDYKAIRHGLENQVEIYNLKNDVAETIDISDSNPELVEQALNYFATMRTDNPNFPTTERK